MNIMFVMFHKKECAQNPFSMPVAHRQIHEFYLLPLCKATTLGYYLLMISREFVDNSRKSSKFR